MNTDRFKFRVWSKQEEGYVKPTRCTISGDGTINIWSRDYESWDDDNEYIIEQCTGLRDKNGTLIYEGDVIDYIFTKHELQRRRFVAWSKRLCSLRLVDLDGYKTVKDTHYGWDFETIITFNERGFDAWDVYKKIEVVGNIHDPQFGFEYPKGDIK